MWLLKSNIVLNNTSSAYYLMVSISTWSPIISYPDWFIRTFSTRRHSLERWKQRFLRRNHSDRKEIIPKSEHDQVNRNTSFLLLWLLFLPSVILLGVSYIMTGDGLNISRTFFCMSKCGKRRIFLYVKYLLGALGIKVGCSNFRILKGWIQLVKSSQTAFFFFLISV